MLNKIGMLKACLEGNRCEHTSYPTEGGREYIEWKDDAFRSNLGPPVNVNNLASGYEWSIIKAEPKFKVGNMVVANDRYLRIIKVESLEYGGFLYACTCFASDFSCFTWYIEDELKEMTPLEQN